MVSQRRHGNRIRLKAYAGVDPDTGKARHVYDSVPADVGKRELDRRIKALEAKAQRLASERRRVRREGLTPRERAEQRDSGEVTFGDAAAAWLDEHLETLEESGRILPVKLLSSYILPRLGDVELWRIRATLTPREAREHPSLVSLKVLYRTLEAEGGTRGGPLSPGTVARIHSLIRQVITYAQGRGWTAGNPARDTRPAPYRRQQRPLPDAANMGAFLEYLAGQHSAVHLFSLLVMTGPRPNEAAALRISSFDLEGGRLYVGKEGVVRVPSADGKEQRKLVSGSTVKRRVRTLRLPGEIIDVVRTRLMLMGELADHCRVAVRPDAFLFSPEPDGSAFFDPHRAGMVFTRWARRARVEGVADLPERMVMYDCRHYGITALLAAGHPVADVAERFGTSPRMIFQTYAHAIPGRDDGMAATLGELLRPSAIPPFPIG